jgi:hypothetical protein
MTIVLASIHTIINDGADSHPPPLLVKWDGPSTHHVTSSRRHTIMPGGRTASVLQQRQQPYINMQCYQPRKDATPSHFALMPSQDSHIVPGCPTVSVRNHAIPGRPTVPFHHHAIVGRRSAVPYLRPAVPDITNRQVILLDSPQSGRPSYSLSNQC